MINQVKKVSLEPSGFLENCFFCFVLSLVFETDGRTHGKLTFSVFWWNRLKATPLLLVDAISYVIGRTEREGVDNSEREKV